MAKRTKLYSKNDWKRESDHSTAGASAQERYREESRRDYARLIHSPSFRRLQGKTQLFPSHESDFFRNRLTHSLEVAQIAKSIAIRANSVESFFKANPIDTNMVEFAGLAHDLGHPPFGHNGENTLDRLMLGSGGFEGNAQTLRLLARVEKKVTTEFPNITSLPRPVDVGNATDLRLGLNLTYRTLASVLKYDRPIQETKLAREAAGTDAKPAKGYYASEAKLVEAIKDHVAPGCVGEFKTIECSIMDVADDIAYSTYDLEDAFKADFLSPLIMISKGDEFKLKIAKKVKENLDKYYNDVSAADRQFGVGDVSQIIAELFNVLLSPNDDIAQLLGSGVTLEEASLLLSAHTEAGSRNLCTNGYLRTAFTSELVGTFVRSVEFHPNLDFPALSRARLTLETFKKVETLKHFVFELLISSPMLKIAEKRGDEIIKKLHECFMGDSALLPPDWRDLFRQIDKQEWQARVVCDYIACMTDRYCVEMYARLTSENPISIWKPH